jgi:DNA-binding NarL/FixJ family response regulator
MRLTLEEEPGVEIVGEADDGEAALRAIPESEPDVVLIDLSMPRTDGLDLIPRIRMLAPDAGIVVYTALISPRVEERALACGADRFLNKGAPLARLREVTRQVARAGAT